MKILITGGSGFIGTRLVEDLLKERHNVLIFDKVISKKYPKLTIIGDVRDNKALIEACKNIDIIYNLAAEHADDVTPKSLYEDVNIGGAKHVVEAATFNRVNNIIFTSSVAIYGLNRGTPDEQTEARPFNEYGRTKNEAENIFVEWANKDANRSLTILRPAVIFGENNRGNVFNLINQIASGKFIMVGKGLNYKSMGYVGNISMFLKNLTNSKPGVIIYNFADKPDLNSNEIVKITTEALDISSKLPPIPYYIGLIGGYTFDIIAFFTRKKFPISSIRVKKFCAETTVNTDKLLASGFKAPFTLKDGLINMIKNDIRKNKG